MKLLPIGMFDLGPNCANDWSHWGRVRRVRAHVILLDDPHPTTIPVCVDVDLYDPYIEDNKCYTELPNYYISSLKAKL